MRQVSDEGLDRDWVLVTGAVMALCFSVGPIIQYSFALFINPLATEFATDRGTISFAATLALLGVAVAMPLCGFLVDRLGSRAVALLSSVLTGGLVILLPYASHSLTTFMIIYLMAAVAATGYSPLVFAPAVASRFEQRRGLALGITMTGVGLGTAILPPLVQMLIVGFGWRNAYLGLGLCVLFLVLPTIFFTVPKNGAGPSRRYVNQSGTTVREAARTSVFWKMLMAFTFVSLAASGVMAHIVAMLADRGIDTARAAFGVSVGGIALIAGRLLSGWLLDKLFAPHVALAFFSMPLLGILILLTSSAPMPAIVATALVGLGLGAEVDLIAYLICRYLGRRAMGALYGYLMTAFMIGTALGPLAMGQSFARLGSYHAALIGFFIALAAACALIAMLGPYRYSSSE